MDIGKVEYYLDIWREYMKQDKEKLGFKSRSSGFNTGGITSFSEMEDDMDYDAARTVDQVIDDLPMLPKNALYIIYLNEKSMINDMLLQQSYDTALIMLQKRLPERNLY